VASVVLAGDHLKSSSDLNLPLVGIGLLYQQGYFRQYLNADGWQQQRYPENDFYNLPLKPERDSEGRPLTICVEFPGRPVFAQVWRVQVGRIPLILLDTNIPQNTPTDQNITDQLYGGDIEMRLQQELILGIGGLRALAAMGIKPTVCHMNEGHSAFLALERARILMQEQNIDFALAQEAGAAGNLFTTHTPVPAGFDVFPADLLQRYFTPYIGQLGISFEDFLALGRVNRTDTAGSSTWRYWRSTTRTRPTASADCTGRSPATWCSPASPAFLSKKCRWAMSPTVSMSAPSFPKIWRNCSTAISADAGRRRSATRLSGRSWIPFPMRNSGA
jgi:alpha-glucan phosphorylase-like protein